jgi:hypothetical protein
LNWRDVLPHRVAVEQERWERCAKVFQARASGATYVAIGRVLSVTAARARELSAKCERAQKKGRLSPAEEFLSQGDISGRKSARKFAQSLVVPWRPQTYSERVWEIKEGLLEEQQRLRRAKDQAERQLRQLQAERALRATEAEMARRRAEAEAVAFRISQITAAEREQREAEKRRWDGVPTVGEHVDKAAQRPEWQRMLRSAKHLNGKAE